MDGLTSAESEERQRKFGLNTVMKAHSTSMGARLIRQFRNPLIVVLLVAAIVTAAIGDYLDAGVIFAVVIINALIGWIQEGRAQQALDAVRSLLVTTATVIRDGRRQEIDAAQVVPGDRVVLDAGARVPADLELDRAHALRVDESVLTGESVAVEKSVEHDDHAYAGTLVVSGSGLGTVTATGERTRMGRIGVLLREEDSLETPLTKRLDRFAWQISAVIVVVGAVAWTFAVLIRGFLPMEAFLAVIGLAVAAIPEGLPAIISIVLAIGTKAMAQRKVIIRRLPAVETLGSVDVICTDKTGTLTRNEMTVVQVLLPDADLEVSGVGYSPEGQVCAADHELSDSLRDAVQQVARIGALCNDAELTERRGEWVIVGDPTEGALLPFAYKTGLDVEQLVDEWELIDEIPFDPRNRYMAVLRRHRDGQVGLFCKGAPEEIAALCRGNDSDWTDRIHQAGLAGQRVLALAQVECPRSMRHIDLDLLASDLTITGMVALLDPPRPEAKTAIEECQKAGIQVVMITGDHEVTALAIGRSLGLTGDSAVSGVAIEEATEDELAQLLERNHVVARASPEAKLRIVRALRQRGLSVAMTGDGVNDAPALQSADVGVAMGKRGTEAARDASDVIITDDNFATIASAVHQGRVVYDNIIKSLQFILPTNGGEAGLILLALALGITLPVTVGQILWVNLVTTVTLALAFAFEPGDPHVMNRPPRPGAMQIVSADMLGRIIFVSVLLIGAALTAFEVGLRWFGSLDVARTMAVTMIVLVEMVYVFNVRRLSGSSLSWRVLVENKIALGAVGLLLVAQMGFVYLPIMQTAFSTAGLAPSAWLVMIVIALVVFLIIELQKWVLRRRERV